jgi:hypothetical protein
MNSYATLGWRWWRAVPCAIALAGAGCSGTCPDGDIDCLVESMVFYDLGTRGSASPGSTDYQQFEPDLDLVADGPMEVVWVETSSLPEPGAAGPDAPQITSELPPVGIGTPSSVSVVQLDYTDPNACRPIFCTRTSRSYFRSPCTPIQNDRYVVGRTYLGWRYESVPERTTEDLEVDVVPLSGPNCPDLSSLAESGDGTLDDPLVLAPADPDVLAAGEAKATTVVIVSEEDASASSGGGGGGEQCSAPSGYCGSCGTVSACVRYDAGGTCLQAWYEAGNGATFACSGCDCTSAANEMPYACGCV